MKFVNLRINCVQVVVKITFEQAARGVNKDLVINIVDVCPKCRGSRSELGYKAIPCTYCNGTGMETVSRGIKFTM